MRKFQKLTVVDSWSSSFLSMLNFSALPTTLKCADCHFKFQLYPVCVSLSIRCTIGTIAHQKRSQTVHYTNWIPAFLRAKERCMTPARASPPLLLLLPFPLLSRPVPSLCARLWSSEPRIPASSTPPPPKNCRQSGLESTVRCCPRQGSVVKHNSGSVTIQKKEGQDRLCML